MKRFYSLIIGIAFAITAATTALAADEYIDVTPNQAYDEAVVDNKVGAYILDVRTDAEFIWVGHPAIDNVINISYKIEKKGVFIVNPSFISEVNEIFGAAKDTPIITMCRSGKRSVDAALALYDAGYTNVYNMLDGFEGGGKDAYGYRTINGWKNSKLPGTTSKIGADDYYQD